VTAQTGKPTAWASVGTVSLIWKRHGLFLSDLSTAHPVLVRSASSWAEISRHLIKLGILSS
jgi:hypothetical protein